MSAPAKAWRLVRRQGIGAVFRAAGEKVYHGHRSIWFARPLDSQLSVIAPQFDGRMDFDHPDWVMAYIKEHDIPGTNDPAEIASMQARGHLFAGVMDGPAIIGYIKIGWDTVYVLDYGIDIRLEPGDFFVIDIYIDPIMRGRGAGPFLVSAASLEMKRRGFGRGVMHVRIDKTPMLKTCARTGYREIGRVEYHSILGWKRFRPHPTEVIRQIDRLHVGSGGRE
jgi:GNAT superfamily N-acetyltransferase